MKGELNKFATQDLVKDQKKFRLFNLSQTMNKKVHGAKLSTESHPIAKVLSH